MNKEKTKNCPFNKEGCSSDCGLYIDPSELNEVVKNKLASIGIIERDRGLCSLKKLSLCMSRIVFEETSSFFR